MRFARSEHNLTEDPSPAFSAGRTLSEMEQALLWSVLQEDPACPSRALFEKAAKPLVCGKRWG